MEIRIGDLQEKPDEDELMKQMKILWMERMKATWSTWRGGKKEREREREEGRKKVKVSLR